jgi:hypothetical protein
MFELPTTVTVGDKEYNIRKKGDYRVILDVFNALNDSELDTQYRIYTALIIFYEDINSIEDIVNTFGDNLQEAVNAMELFFNCGEESIGARVPYILIDWKKDSQMIASAVNQVAKTEVRALDYLHWWTFMGYYLAIGESPFATIVSIRSKIKRGKKLEKYEQDFRKENPQYFIWDDMSADAKKQQDEIMGMWNKG